MKQVNSEYPGFRLSIANDTNSATVASNHFAADEIASNIKYHRHFADKAMRMFNENLGSAVITVKIGSRHEVISIDCKDAYCIDALKKLIYELSVFHINKRIAWEMIDPKIETVGK